MDAGLDDESLPGAGDVGAMNAIVVVDSGWGIGCCGKQTIVIPEDRKHFRELTSGGVVIVGRKTFECMPGPLPNRKNIVLTRGGGFRADGAVITRTVDEALAEVGAADSGGVFVIGGGEIYRLFLPRCRFAYVTKVEAAVLADTFFPDLDSLPDWELESKSETRTSECGFMYTFNRYRCTLGATETHYETPTVT